MTLPTEFMAESQMTKAPNNPAFALALEGSLEQGVTEVLKTEVNRQKIVFPRMSRAIW